MDMLSELDRLTLCTARTDNYCLESIMVRKVKAFCRVVDILIEKRNPFFGLLAAHPIAPDIDVPATFYGRVTIREEQYLVLTGTISRADAPG
jgi:hypothetical protein